MKKNDLPDLTQSQEFSREEFEHNSLFAEAMASCKPLIETELLEALRIYRQCLDVREAIMFIGGAGTPEAAEALRDLNNASARVHELRDWLRRI